jgi:hypothetical protein
MAIVFEDGESGRDAECGPQRERIVADVLHRQRDVRVVTSGD